MRTAAAAHPDATGGGADASSAINAAYHELSDPLRRAGALLRRLGAPAVQDPGLPSEFLMEAMEIREQVDAARGDPGALASIRGQVLARHREALDGIAAGFLAVQGAADPPDASATSAILASINLARALARVLEQIDAEEERSR
jgi:curved DNA-binding protein CbpA